MDPLHPITPGVPALPSRRVPAIARLPRVSRDGDRPGHEKREGEQRREPREDEPGEDPGEGRVDVRV